jgi:hypothetical protein
MTWVSGRQENVVGHRVMWELRTQLATEKEISATYIKLHSQAQEKLGEKE